MGFVVQETCSGFSILSFPTGKLLLGLCAGRALRRAGGTRCNGLGHGAAELRDKVLLQDTGMSVPGGRCQTW